MTAEPLTENIDVPNSCCWVSSRYIEIDFHFVANNFLVLEITCVTQLLSGEGLRVLYPVYYKIRPF